MSIILTGCGKTIFVKAFLRNLSLMSDVRFERILFYYAEWQKTYRQLQYDIRIKELEEQHWECSNTKTTKKNIIEFCERLPRPENYSNDPLSPKLVIIDDLMRKSCDTTVDLFTKGSHHKNLSVIFISQTSSIRDVVSMIYHLTQITSSFSKINALKFVI